MIQKSLAAFLGRREKKNDINTHQSHPSNHQSQLLFATSHSLAITAGHMVTHMYTHNLLSIVIMTTKSQHANSPA